MAPQPLQGQEEAIDQGSGLLYVLNIIVVDGLFGGKHYTPLCHYHFTPSLYQKTKTMVTEPIS